uniref:BUD23 rRNA methyltransferase and ribosome maturation factor n=1 Tax=Prolemur simus TaxID=1328070 RepID=A0A8C9DRV8_PROSS
MAFRGRRPEHGGPPELFYDENEARKYVRNSRMIDVQTRMAGRALELLCLPEGQPCYLLDIGCGSGLSGNYLSDEGHYWVGIDISPAMLAFLLCSGSVMLTRNLTFLPSACTAFFLLFILFSSVEPELSCSCTLRTRSR